MTTLQTRECEYHPDVMEGREHLSTFITTEPDESSDKFCPLRKFQPGTLPLKKNNENSHVKAELKASESDIHHRMETGDTASMQHHSYSGGTKPKSHSNEGGGSGSNSGSSSSKGQKQKSGSESGSSGHGSSSSSHHQSQQGGGMRGFGSSGDSDENDDDDKKRRLPRGLNKEPKSRVSFTEEDDEATDSADEGRSDEGMDYSGYAPVANKGSTFESGASLRQTTPGTITVESVGPGIIGTTLLTGPQLASPINMSVGYGVPETMAPRVIDKSPSGSGSRVGTPTLDSPRPSDGRGTPGTPELSPMIAPAPQQSSTMALTSVVASSIPTAGGSVQPSPSIPTGSFSLPFETAWGWQPQVYSPFPLTAGSHPGSLATTPAPTDSGPFLRPGTSIFLPATVCQESDGVLIVSVRWRNTTFSGSLIDMGQHEWAPPRLSCEPAVKVKDLYNSWQESENQQVNVDGEEDETKDNDNENEVKDITMTTTETHSQPEGSATTKPTETGQKKQSSMETTSEAECSATRTEEDLPELVMKPRSRRESLTMLPKQPQQPESHYSDISDASDAEMELSEEKSVVTQPILLPPLNGMFWPPAAARPVVKEQKTASQDVHMQTQKQHQTSSLPTFSKIGESEDTMKIKSQPKHKGGINNTIPDSKPLSQKESPAAILRSNLLSSYPNTSTATPSEVTVSAPGQDHRHSVAVKTGVSANRTSTSPHSTRASTPPPSTRPGGIISNVHFSPLNTLVNVAVSMEPVTAIDDTRKVPSPLKEKSRNRLNFDSMPPPQQAKPPPTTTTAKFVSIVDYATNDNKKSLKEDVPRSTSPRPDSLMPDQRATRTRRSPSPSGFNKFKVQEGQFVGLPPFEDPPIVVKPKTAKATFGYGPPGVDPTVLVQSKDEGHDSDSSGSGSILHSSTSSQKRKGGRRKKRAEPLSVLKTDSTKIPREEQGMKQPETPSLAPMTLGDFKLKIQPISPGIDVPPYHHHQHLSQKQPKDSNSSTGFPSPSTMPSLPPPQVGQPDAKKPTSRMTSSPKPIHTTTVGDMMKKIEPTLSGHHQQAFISTAIPQPPHKTGKPVTSTPSTSMLMAAEHDASLPHNMLTKSQNQSMTTPGAGIPFSHVMLAPHHSPPISIQTHGSIVTPAVIQTPSGDGSKNEPRNTSIGAGASGNINTAHSPRPGKTPGRKRKPGPDIQMEASKRSPPVRDREESRESGPNILPPLPPSLLVNAKSQVSKQVLEEFMPPDEGKEKIKMETLPEGFDYDPYLPMSKELQLLSFENQQLARQKKFEYQQQQQMAIEQLRKEEQSAKMRAAKPHSRKRQKTGVSANSTSTSPHSTRASTPPPSTRPRGIISNVHFSPLNTLVNVAVSMESVTATSQDDTRKVPSPLKEKSRNRLNFDSMPPPQQAKPPPTTTTAKFVSIVDYATNDNKKSLKEDVPRSTSPRPDSLMPDQRATQTRRSPSPSGFNKFKVQEGQFVGLPPFEDPPIVVKPKTAKATFGYGPPGVDPTVLVQSKDEGHDSDSSGSGSILHSSTSSQKRKGGRRKKRAEPLSVLKTDSTKIPREEQGMKQPEAPSLAPMTLGDFKLKIQPISPGIDVPPYHHHQHLSQKQPKDSNTPPPSTRPDDYYISICEQVMRESGAMDQTIMHCIFVGPAGVGKSSLLKRLLRMKLDPKRTSTQIAEKSVQVEVIRDVSITTAQVSGLEWQKIEDLDSQASGLIGQLSTKHEQAVSQVSKPTTSKRPDSEPPERSQFSKPISLFRNILKKKGVSELQHVSPWTLYLTDSGGQPDFQELLPALVVGPCVFFVVIPLDKDLQRKYVVEYLRPDEQKCMQKYLSSLTIQEDLLRSLASIASTKYEDKDGNEVKPRIMLVATFKDKVPREEDRQRRLKELQDVVKETDAFRQHMIVEASETQMVFTINNISDDESEKDAKEIRNAFCILADEFKVHVPSPWLIFSILIQHEYAKETVISKKQCFKVAQECGIHTETECEAALQFLYKQTGMLRYYKEPSELNQIVIKDPQHLFSRVNQLVEKTFIFKETRSRQCTEDFKRGIFSRVDYDKLTKESTSNSKLTPTMLLKLLEHLNVVVPLGGGEKYFMPCAIAHLDEATAIGQMQSATIPPLLITFKCGYCPKGLFGALVACIANKQVANCTLDLDESQIHRNQICFTMGLYRLLLRITPTYIYIEVIPDSAIVSLSPELCTLCNSVRKLIEGNITEACKTLRYSDNANYSLSFVCQCDQHAQLHPAHLRNDPVQRHIFLCSQSKKNAPVNPESHVWLPEPIIMQHPDCQSVEAGTEAVFRVNATGDKLHFQWQKNHRNLCDSDRYCGIETDTLHIIEVEKRDKGRYRCIVKNDMESKPSKEALLAITKFPAPPVPRPAMLQPNGAGITLLGQDLHILTEIMRPAAPQWRTIGGSLGISDFDLNIIQHTPILISEGPLGYFREMLSQWLKWAPPNHPLPTLEALATALQSSGNESLAVELKPMFLQRKDVSGRPGGPAYNQLTMSAAPHQTQKQPCEQMQMQRQPLQQPLALASTSYPLPQQPGQLGESMPQKSVGMPTPQQMQPKVQQQMPPETHTHQDRPQFYPQPTMPIPVQWTQPSYFWMSQTQLPFAGPTQWWHPLQQAHPMYQPQLQPQQLAPPPEPTTSQTSLPSGSTTPAMVSLQFQPDPASKSNETQPQQQQ